MRAAFRRSAWILVMLLASVGPALGQTETIEYYGTDAVGSVRVVFDANGNVLGRMDYEPFGRELFNGLFPVTEHFGGQSVDGESGTAHFHARQYAVRTGRFSRVDPIYVGVFEPQAWNRYAYTLNNPVRYQDPTGLDPSNPCGVYDGCVTAPYIDAEADFWNGFQFMPPVYGDLPLSNWFTLHEARFDARRATRQGGIDGKGGGASGGGGKGGGGDEGRDRDRHSGIDVVQRWLCSALPEGRVTSIGGGIGGIGGETGSLSLVINYNDGQVSGFVTGGLQGGWNGIAQGSVSGGFVYGALGADNSGYSGIFTTGSFSGAIFGAFGSYGSGVSVFGASAGGSMTGATYTLSRTTTSSPLQYPKILGDLALTPLDRGFMFARWGVCQ